MEWVQVVKVQKNVRRHSTNGKRRFCRAFSPLALSHPFSSVFQTLASYFLPQSSPFLPFSLSSCPLCLCGYFSVFICVRSTELTTKSPRTLRWTIAILYRDHKKARERFWYETQKMQSDTDLRKYFKDLNKIIYAPFGWYLYFLYLSSAGSIVHDWTEMFGIVHGLCWFKTHSPVKPCGSNCKIEPSQVRRMG